MNQHRYDIIALGDSLASRLATVLLAKAGKKVLTFRPQHPPFTPWLFNSIHLGQVLDQLGGRNNLTAARKLQVITGESRLELHGREPLSEELRREFPSSHNQVAHLLQTLEVLGNRLESQLLSSGGLPLFDLAGRLRFRRKLLLSRFGFLSLRKPLLHLLDEITDKSPRICLDALFSGLAMAPIERLTVAEGALLWAGACQTQEISIAALDDLLQRRYEQFHGCSEPLDTIKEIGKDGIIHLKNSRTNSADTLIIGSSRGIGYLPVENRKLVKAQPPLCRWETSPILIGASPVLASRVILSDPLPLRVTLTPSPTGTVCTAESKGADASCPPSEDKVRLQLAGILPFASFSLSPVATHESASVDEFRWPASRAFPGTALRLRLKNSLLLGSGADAVPYLGGTGEIMTGVALARYLLWANKQGP